MRVLKLEAAALGLNCRERVKNGDNRDKSKALVFVILREYALLVG